MKDTGLLIINLGSPDNADPGSVRKYLRKFLMDKYVIDVPFVLRKIIVEGFILPFRPQRSAHAYQAVWTEKGSPLKVITSEFAEEIEKRIDIPVAVSMRYGNPTPADGLAELRRKVGSLKTVYIAPMYPHFAMSSYQTGVEHVLNEIKSGLETPELKVLKPFYSDHGYVESVANSIRSQLEKGFDHILFSYHGLPVRHLRKSDTSGSHCYTCANCCDQKSVAWDTCYKHQTHQTTKLVAEKLKLTSDQFSISYQSRLGRDEWIQPFTNEKLKNLPAQGIKRLIIVCPAFVADCLETLEEIGITGKRDFIEAGGRELTVVPCLNTDSIWLKTFAGYVNNRQAEHLHLWSSYQYA